MSAALNAGGWSIPADREHANYITVIDAAGRVVARVPRRADDLAIARAIAALPDLLACAEQLADRAIADKPTVNKFRAALARAKV